MADEIPVATPKVESFAIKGSLKGELKEVYHRISTLPMFELKLGKDVLTVARVESRDMQKKPFLFMVVDIMGSGIEVQYTIVQDTSERLRRMKVLGVLVNILSLIDDIYSVDDKELYQYLGSSIESMLNSLSDDYSTLFNKYDYIFNDYRNLKRTNLELSAANRTLEVEGAQLSRENDTLKDRLKELEKYSDEALMGMVQDWIEAHGSTIDINEFANYYKMTPTRVEQILNKMVELGDIEARG